MSDQVINGFDFSKLPITITYVGKVEDKQWPHFLWQVNFKNRDGFWTIPYKCGLAHCKKDKFGREFPTKPSNADIMYSLLLDSDAEDYNFNDWCDCFGYSNDSISAFKTYQDCLSVHVHLKKYIDGVDMEAMREALQDFV